MLYMAEKSSFRSAVYQLRLDRGWKKKQLAAASGLTEKTIYEAERTQDPGEFSEMTLVSLAKAFGLSPEALMTQWRGMSTTPLREPWDNNAEPYTEQSTGEIPTFDLAVAAGSWMEVPENGELNLNNKLEAAKHRTGIFRIRLRGDSMEKVWPDGSLVEFRLLKWDGLLEEGDRLETGQDYYVQKISEATFKRLEVIRDDELVFRAINKKKYPAPMVVQREEIVRMAKAEYLLTRRSV